MLILIFEYFIICVFIYRDKLANELNNKFSTDEILHTLQMFWKQQSSDSCDDDNDDDINVLGEDDVPNIVHESKEYVFFFSFFFFLVLCLHDCYSLQ